MVLFNKLIHQLTFIPVSYPPLDVYKRQACIDAQHFGVPVVFAKKSKSVNLEGEMYVAEVESFTHKCKNQVIVAKKFLNENDRVLIIDDFLANGCACLLYTSKANVPLVSGTGLLKGVDEAIVEAEKIGYPVMIKSTAGGGGIGIRICENKDELVASYDNVCHLAESNVNDAGVFLEKYIRKARHVEVQIFGNEYGEVATLGERDCSVQRRNQKVVEESPAPNLSDTVREQMYTCLLYTSRCV